MNQQTGKILCVDDEPHNLMLLEAMLRPFQQTANLCGMKWLTPVVVNSVLPSGITGFKNLSDDDIKKCAEEYKEFLKQYMI